jgi:hypothetical protein
MRFASLLGGYINKNMLMAKYIRNLYLRKKELHDEEDDCRLHSKIKNG